MMRLACAVLLVSSAAAADREMAPPSAGSAAQPPTGGYAPEPGVGLIRPTIAPSGPPAEVAALAKQMVGTWTCKGNTLRGDGSSTPLIATVTNKLELDGAWISTSLAEKRGPLKLVEYRTYDPTAKLWTRVQLSSTGSKVEWFSNGEEKGTWMWTGTGTSSGGYVALREYEQKSDKTLKIWAEAQTGATWNKRYEVACTKQ